MRAALGMLRMRFIYSLQYRAAAWAGVMTQVFWGFMETLLYKAFYASNAAAFPMTLPQVTCYIWLRQAFFAMFILWSVDGDILDMIINGNVGYEIIRPTDLYWMWFTRNLGSRLSKVALRCGPVFLVAFLLPAPFGLSLPPNWVTFFAFLLSFVMAVLLIIGLCMWIYILSFYTIASRGVQSIVGLTAEFLSGSLLPIPFMPESFQKVAYLLPFAQTQAVPYLMYSGYYSGREMVMNLGVQLFWLIVVIGSGHAVMKRALLKVTVQGG